MMVEPGVQNRYASRRVVAGISQQEEMESAEGVSKESQWVAADQDAL